MLGVAILIIVMSVMNGFKTELTSKILGLNPHLVVQPNSFQISENFVEELKNNFQEIRLSKSYFGEGIILNNKNAKGAILKGVDKNEINIKEFFDNYISSGDLNNFTPRKVLIGSEMAFNLNLSVGDPINLMTSTFISTPLGSLPKQENFKVAGIFTTGFLEFDTNLVFLNLEDALSMFEKENTDLNIEIYLKDPMEAMIYKDKIQKFNQNYFIYTWSDLNKSLFSALKLERNVMFIILSLIVVVAKFSI